MPREKIQPGPFEVSWSRDAFVNLELRRENYPDLGITAIRSDLNRADINALIRVLRRARDQAFGADA